MSNPKKSYPPRLEKFWKEWSIRRIEYELAQNKYKNAILLADNQLWLFPDDNVLAKQILETFLTRALELIEENQFSVAKRLFDFSSKMPMAPIQQKALIQMMIKRAREAYKRARIRPPSPPQSNASLRRLETTAKNLGWSAASFLELRDDYQNQLAAKGEASQISEKQWVQRRIKLNERRVAGATSDGNAQQPLFTGKSDR